MLGTAGMIKKKDRGTLEKGRDNGFKYLKP